MPPTWEKVPTILKIFFFRPIWSQSWLTLFDVKIMWQYLWVAAGMCEVYLKPWLLWRCICVFFPLSFIQSLLSHWKQRHQGRFHANILFGNDVITMGSSVLSDGRLRRKGVRISLILASSNIIMECHNPVVRLPKNTHSLHLCSTVSIMLFWKHMTSWQGKLEWPHYNLQISPKMCTL